MAESKTIEEALETALTLVLEMSSAELRAECERRALKCSLRMELRYRHW